MTSEPVTPPPGFRARVDAIPAAGQAAASVAIIATVWVAAVTVNRLLGSSVPPGDLLGALAAVTVVAVAYVIPTFVGDRRHHPNQSRIRAVNLALGWTGIGWVAALTMALTPPTRR